MSAVQVSLFAELFNEMLMRDSGFTIYKAILEAPEKKEEEKEKKDKDKEKSRDRSGSKEPNVKKRKTEDEKKDEKKVRISLPPTFLLLR